MHGVQLGYVGLGVSDLDQWNGFARDFLGVASERTEAGNLMLRMDDRKFRYFLGSTDEDDIREIGWEVGSQSDLERIHARLKARGVQVASTGFDAEEALGANTALVFADPDGLRSIVYLAPSLPRSPLSLPRGHAGFVTGDQGAGHMVLAASSLDQTLDFYGDVLGFAVTDYIVMSEDAPPAVFLHCNPRHHTLAFYQAQPQVRLNHIMVQCRDFDDVGIAMDLAKEQQLDFVQELGKHSNDHMTSFYVRTPSGFEVEYGWGGRVVDDDWSVATYDHISKWGHRRLDR